MIIVCLSCVIICFHSIFFYLLFFASFGIEIDSKISPPDDLYNYHSEQ